MEELLNATNNTSEIAPVETAAPAVPAISPEGFGLSDAITKELEDIGIVTGSIGTRVSRIPIEKYKASTTKIDRISFLSSNIMAVKMHYLEEKGSFLCFGKKCCEICGIPTVRYLFPVVVYQTDRDGTLVGSKINLNILSAGEDLYKNIQTIAKGAESAGGITAIDLLVTCTDDKYQKITLAYVGKAAWRTSPAAIEYLKDRWNAEGKYAYMAVARKVDEPTFLRLAGYDSDQEAPQLPKIDPADFSKFFGEDD